MVKNPFTDFDPAALMAGFRTPGFDAEAAVALQRKNIETATAVNRIAFEGAGAILRRQNELAREAVEACTTNFNALVGAADTDDRAGLQAAFAKGAYEAMVTGTKELAAMASKTQTEVLGLIDQRIREAIDETGAIIAAPAAGAAEQ